MVEKLDGMMIGVFFDNGTPHWHTRKTLSSSPDDLKLASAAGCGVTTPFLELVGEHVHDLRWDNADKNRTYVFEFVHKLTCGTTEYHGHQAGLYLIGSRDVRSFVESHENGLDSIANQIGVRRPRLWNALNERTEIESMMAKMRNETPGFEGFVFRDRGSGKRIKVKDPEYVKVSHMLGEISYKRLIPLYLKGETEEVVAYFPGAKPRLDEIEQLVTRYLDRLVDACITWRDRAQREGIDRKRLIPEVSLQHQDRYLISQVMKHFQQTSDEAIRSSVKADLWRMGGAESTGANLKRFASLIGSVDVE